MNFKMCATLKMSRAINKTEDYISPGGYEIESGGKNYAFDFESYTGYVDKNDPSVLHIENKNPDESAFPNVRNITRDVLKNITRFVEFYVFTGEANETDLYPVALLDCTFYIDEEMIEVPSEVCKSTETCCAFAKPTSFF